MKYIPIFGHFDKLHDCQINVWFQFQKRKYASLRWFKCGKKGYGLKALGNVAKGQFLIEYVGEVKCTVPFYYPYTNLVVLLIILLWYMFYWLFRMIINFVILFILWFLILAEVFGKGRFSITLYEVIVAVMLNWSQRTLLLLFHSP